MAIIQKKKSVICENNIATENQVWREAHLAGDK